MNPQIMVNHLFGAPLTAIKIFVGFITFDIQLGTDSKRTVVAESLRILTGTQYIETPIRIKMRIIYKKVPHQKLNVLLQGG